MIDDLVTRLRALADEHKYPLVGWEQRLVATLREAADALERAEIQIVGLKLDMPIPDKLMGQLIGCNTDLNSEMLALSDERDTLKARVEAQDCLAASTRKAYEALQAKLEHVELERNCMEERLAEDQERLAEAEQRRDYWMGRANENHSLASEARAEAAALREALERIIDNKPNDYPAVHIADEALSQPGPGAALLERVRKLEKVADAARNHDCVEKPTCRICEAVAAFDAKETP